MAKASVKIEIVAGGNGYTATVDEDPYSRAFTEEAKWKVNGVNTLPDGAVVYLQFVDTANGKTPIDGPLWDGKRRGGKYRSQKTGNTTVIESVVAVGATARYHYQIGYELDGVKHLLLDPEIVIEGNVKVIAKFLRARVAEWKQSLRRRSGQTATKKAKKARTAIQAKKAKKR